MQQTESLEFLSDRLNRWFKHATEAGGKSMSAFGELLRQYRERSAEPAHEGRLTQARLAELLEQEPSTGSYTGATISHWEKGKYRIDHDDRGVLIGLVKVLHRCGGIESLAEANRLLLAGNYRPLDEDEINRISPAWLSTPSVASGGSAAHFPPPFMVPALPPQGILGRKDDIQQIVELLMLEHADADIPPVALLGMGGVGKTTLATAMARSELVARHFPDGVLWAALGPRPAVRPLLDQWGQALGLDLLALPDEAACQQRLRALLSSRRMLLIVDDVWDAKQGRIFAIGGRHCRMLLTTREPPIAHDLATRARTIRVDILSPAASLELLRHLAPEAVGSDEVDARRLCEKLEFLPLALTLAGRLLANETDVPARMEHLLHELMERRDARLKLLQDEGRLGLSETEPVSLQAILGMSVERLSELDQDRFAMLSVFGGEPLTWEIHATSHIWGCSVEEAEATTARLAQRGLIEHRRGRYWLHALLADYAEMLREAKGL